MPKKKKEKGYRSISEIGPSSHKLKHDTDAGQVGIGKALLLHGTGELIKYGSNLVRISIVITIIMKCLWTQRQSTVVRWNNDDKNIVSSMYICTEDTVHIT